jgi:hypothetical protein
MLERSQLFARRTFETKTKADAATEECAVVESN